MSSLQPFQAIYYFITFCVACVVYFLVKENKQVLEAPLQLHKKYNERKQKTDDFQALEQEIFVGFFFFW
jgi:hypothetical protein